MKLKKGMLLGTANSVVVDPTPNGEAAEADPAVALVTEDANADRKEQMLKAVKVNSSGLSSGQLVQMQDLLREYDDIFSQQQIRSLIPSTRVTTNQYDSHPGDCPSRSEAKQMSLYKRCSNKALFSRRGVLGQVRWCW